MGYNYFGKLESNFTTYINLNKPIIIRCDAENVTKNLTLDMLNQNVGEFAYALIYTARELSKKFHTFVFCGTDEIDFIFTDGNNLKERFSNRKTQKIVSIMSQEVFLAFNHFYKYQSIYFDGKCFNIPFSKIYSYFVYRQKSTYCVNNTYLAKRNLDKFEYCNLSLENICKKLKEKCPNINRDYLYFQKGLIFLDGKMIEFEKYFDKNYIPIID